MLIALVALASAPLAHAEPISPSHDTLAGPTVVLLWASWCASCKAELERLPRLSSAASPLPIRTLAIDPPGLARDTLLARHQPIDGAFADRRPARAVLDDWGGAGAALPLAVAVDRHGRICGRKRGLLGTDQLRDWASRCSH